ncbi:transcription initiation factor TFIID subunit 7-like [Nylanderia fulva]|uniref:transcription initiation factor TFIID subunit 7-like n=1 Tax=Nylanderia fulva TaxID=613905 RepID=UPI0010FAF68E|nr:transcription initiation factor TFIID subunit 7-like [Nylanderia fulva]
MEEQFILRVPEGLKSEMENEIRNKGYIQNSSIEILENNRAIFKYKDSEHQGVIVRLPCIIESHKTLDCKQYYKVSDVSTMIYILPKEIEGAESEIETRIKLIELSGLSPPLKFCKIRRFRKRSSKSFIIEEIEAKVRELIEKERNSLSVEIQFSGKGMDEETEEENVSSLVAELEYNLIESNRHTKEQESKREKGVGETMSEKEEVDKKSGIELKLPSGEVMEKLRQLDELKRKINEKESQLKSVTNILLIRRFQDSINVLKEEYEKLSEEMEEIKRSERK